MNFVRRYAKICTDVHRTSKIGVEPHNGQCTRNACFFMARLLLLLLQYLSPLTWWFGVEHRQPTPVARLRAAQVCRVRGQPHVDVDLGGIRVDLPKQPQASGSVR